MCGDCRPLRRLRGPRQQASRPIFQRIWLTAMTVTMISVVKLEMIARLTNTLSAPSPNLSASVLNGVAAVARALTWVVEAPIVDGHCTGGPCR